MVRGLFTLSFTSLFLVGCTDSAGNRITMQEWWKSRSTSNQPSHNRIAESDKKAENTPKPAERPQESTDGDATEASDVRLAARRDVPRDDAPPRAADDSPNAVRADHLVVDDEIIRVQDILEPLQSRLPSVEAEVSPESYWRKVADLVRQQIIEAVAQHLIWRRASQSMGDELKPQLEKAVEKMEKDRINREFDGRETAYAKYLSKHGKTRDEVRDRLRRSVLIDSYLRDRLLPMVPQPRKQELQEYYNSHLQDFSRQGRREMYLIDIPIAAFLDLNRPLTREDERIAAERARKAIDAAVADLKANRPFEEVAKQYSQGLHKDEGGFWGWITEAPPGQSAPLLGHWEAPSRKLFELASGQTSEVLEAARSYFIVKAGQVEKPQTLSFQEAQPEIINQLRQQRFIKLRADFLQKELDRSTLGSLDSFVRAVLNAVPGQGAARLDPEGTGDAIPGRSPRLSTESSKKHPSLQK